MSHFRSTNLYPGQCTQCQKLVPKGAGTATNAHGMWHVTHKDCFASLLPLVHRVPTPRQPLKNQLLGVPDFPEKHRYGQDMGLSDPLPIATNPKEIAFHLASVLCMALQFRVAE